MKILSNSSRFPAAMDIQFAVDAVHLRLHGIDRDNQFTRNFWIGKFGNKKMQDALFLACQWLEKRHRALWSFSIQPESL